MCTLSAQNAEAAMWTESAAAAIALCSEGKGGGAASGSKAPTERQAQQKRDADKRKRQLALAAENVRATWEAILQLKGRGRDKKRKTTEFTAAWHAISARVYGGFDPRQKRPMEAV